MSSCIDKRTESIKNDNSEFYFHPNGEISLFIGERKFETPKAEKLNDDGIKFIKQDSFEKAKESFEKALKIEPNNVIILNNLGTIEHDLKNYYVSISYHEKSFSISDSTYLPAALSLGLLYWKDYDFHKSKQILKYIVENTDEKSTLLVANIYLTWVYSDLNECEKANQSLKNVNYYLDEIGFSDKATEFIEIENCW